MNKAETITLAIVSLITGLTGVWLLTVWFGWKIALIVFLLQWSAMAQLTLRLQNRL